LRHTVSKFATPEQSDHGMKIPAEEHGPRSEGVQIKKRISGRRNAGTNVTIPGESDLSSKIESGKNITTNKSSRHVYPTNQSTDQIHSSKGDSSQASIVRNSVKKYTYNDILVKTTDPEQLFKPGTVMGTKGKPAPIESNPKERIIQARQPGTSLIKPSRHDRQTSKTSIRSSPVKNTEKPEEHPGKNFWPRLPEELSVGSAGIEGSVSSSWKGAENLWPELPEAKPSKSYDELIINYHERERLLRVDREQKGILWNV
ncbi:MAG: hypothetical protein JSU90_03685, partial [Nitrospiraceae bacterium]